MNNIEYLRDQVNKLFDKYIDLDKENEGLKDELYSYKRKLGIVEKYKDHTKQDLIDKLQRIEDLRRWDGVSSDDFSGGV